jgi:hypothetical protein
MGADLYLRVILVSQLTIVEAFIKLAGITGQKNGSIPILINAWSGRTFRALKGLVRSAGGQVHGVS